MKPLLLIIALLLSSPAWAELEHSAKKQSECERLVKSYASQNSYQWNKNYYGKGVEKPSSSDWKLKRYSEPFLFRKSLTYVYEAETSDGFVHQAQCKFEGSGWLSDFCVMDHTHDYGCIPDCEVLGC